MLSGRVSSVARHSSKGFKKVQEYHTGDLNLQTKVIIKPIYHYTRSFTYVKGIEKFRYTQKELFYPICASFYDCRVTFITVEGDVNLL